MDGAEFVSLSALLLRDAAPQAPPREPDPQPESLPAAVSEPLAADLAAALRDARLFSARLADALEAAVARLLRDLACDVLVRELRLAPAQIDELVRRCVAQTPVLRVRIAPDEPCRIVDVPTVVDAALVPGDAILEVVGGAFDLRLGVRLADVLAALA